MLISLIVLAHQPFLRGRELEVADRAPQRGGGVAHMREQAVARLAQQPAPARLARLVLGMLAKRPRLSVVVVHSQRPRFACGAAADVAAPALEGEQAVVLLRRHMVARAKVLLASGLTTAPGLLHLSRCPAPSPRLSGHYRFPPPLPPSPLVGPLPAHPVVLVPGPFFELALPPLSPRPGPALWALLLPPITQARSGTCPARRAGAGSRRTRGRPGQCSG